MITMIMETIVMVTMARTMVLTTTMMMTTLLTAFINALVFYGTQYHSLVF